MKICFLLGGFYQNGGIGRVTSVLANRLAEEPDFEIVTLGYFNPHKPNIYKLSPKIHEEYFLKSYERMTKVMLKGGERKLRKYLCSNEIDVLIACGALFFPIATRACSKIRTKCICWEHSNPEGNNDHKGQNIARKYGIKRADMNVVLTQKALQVYKEKYNALNTVQIYNPIDQEVLRHSKGYNSDSKKIVSVGRLTYQKNFETAVEVAEDVLLRHPDWEWDVFGQGEELDKLVVMTKEKGIDKQMHFKGQVSDLYDRYSDYAIMVMTSRYEGFAMTLLEGMGNGIPLVSFDIPTGPSEIITDNKNGFLIEAFDKQTMAKKINRMIEEKILREKMSLENKNLMSMFDEEVIIKEWIEVLVKIIKQ